MIKHGAAHLQKNSAKQFVWGRGRLYWLKDKVMGMALFQTEQTATLLTAEGDLYILKSSHQQ